ncbi:hypothetical protein JYT87_01460 [Nitrospira defluvii]|nr:hypothetical protein [Nitrospira defluvii]
MAFVATTSWVGTITGKVAFPAGNKKNAAAHLVDMKTPVVPPIEHEF